MKSFLTSLILAAGLFVGSHTFAQDPSVTRPAPAADLKAPASTNTQMSAKEQEANTAQEDDALYRGKTGEMESTFIRDEGALHFKTHGREKVQEVDSKNLRTSGIDKTFQGRLLHDSLTSIEDVGAKQAEETHAVQQIDAQQQLDSQGRRHQVFGAPTDEVKKSEPARAKSDASPSPSPSASASPSPSKR